jgi:hypothetical protein
MYPAVVLEELVPFFMWTYQSMSFGVLDLFYFLVDSVFVADR